MMVYKGLADGMVSGADSSQTGVNTVSSIFFMLLHDRVPVKTRAQDLLIEGRRLLLENKRPNSSGAGKANVLIFPDLNTGNNTYKAVQRETKSLATREPINEAKTFIILLLLPLYKQHIYENSDY
ncbi:phosphate acyltransferase [Candidatus Walczuchella monophlebidarum]|uniref:phosphate acyltransferase n=1 Tax=Candidatus Walczuchella monophlebidarum TaxID=1415657 RepID=UPI001F1BCCB8|nr:phosphate acyltransferase [Candidatus Walczuchella monophlebidarum]